MTDVVLVAGSAQFSSAQFSSVQDRIYALGKAHMRSPTPSLRRFFPNAAFETVSMFVLIDDGPLSSFKGRSSSASSFHASLLQAIDRWCDVLWVCTQVVSQAPQHFRSSEKQATSGGCWDFKENMYREEGTVQFNVALLYIHSDGADYWGRGAQNVHHQSPGAV